MTTQVHSRIPTVIRELADVLDGIDSRSDSDPTPCSEFTVADLRAHVVTWMTSFAAGLEDPEGRCPTDPIPVDSDDVAGEVRGLADRIAAGADAPPDALYIGEAGMPTHMALAMILGEYIVHGWDLAVATGQRWAPEEGAVEDSLAFLESALTEESQGEGKDFAPRVQVADSAPVLSRLLGVTGRDPHWSRG